MKRLLQIHLALALFCLPFLSIYAFDGILCGHRGWVREEPRINEQQFSVKGNSAEDMATELKQEHGLEGHLAPGSESSRFWLDATLVGHDVELISPGQVRVKTYRFGVIEGSHSLHATVGLNRQFGPAIAWGIVVIMVSLSLIALRWASPVSGFGFRASRSDARVLSS